MRGRTTSGDVSTDQMRARKAEILQTLPGSTLRDMVKRFPKLRPDIEDLLREIPASRETCRFFADSKLGKKVFYTGKHISSLKNKVLTVTRTPLELSRQGFVNVELCSCVYQVRVDELRIA